MYVPLAIGAFNAFFAQLRGVPWSSPQPPCPSHRFGLHGTNMRKHLCKRQLPALPGR